MKNLLLSSVLFSLIIGLGVSPGNAVTPTQECQAQKAIASGEWQLCLAQEKANKLRGLRSRPGRCNNQLKNSLAAIDLAIPVECGYAVSPGGPRQTGQKTCYNVVGDPTPCAGTGHDAETRAGSQTKFVDNGDGTISDMSTGLMWEKLSDDDSIHDKDDVIYTWAQALSVKLATLNSQAFAGYSDWRIPNVRELETLIDFGTTDPAVPGVFAKNCGFHSYGNGGCTVLGCSCTRASFLWSSTEADYNHTSEWVIDFFVGQVSTASRGAGGAAGARAVRGGL